MTKKDGTDQQQQPADGTQQPPAPAPAPTEKKKLTLDVEDVVEVLERKISP